MAHEEQEPNKKHQYPLGASSYKILDKIGVGVSATVYKAICIPMDSTVVAIKSIDLDNSRAGTTSEDFVDSLRRETKTMSLLSHPNILQAHCSFTVDRRLWVVMPFMSGGSLQSIISSSFKDGLPESCIAVVLKETLNALSYLHNQGHLHRDIKAGNILVDSNTGQVKLADFGVSASIYETSTGPGWGPSSSRSSRLMLTDVAGTPYWMAPEVIHSHVGYSFKADIWSFGITALELAHGRPPLSHLPPSKSLIMKITKRFRFSDYDKHHEDEKKKKKFSKSFKEMVASCLDQDPSKRPSAEKLLKHSFFKNCKGPDFLVRNVLQGLPTVEERFKESQILHGTSNIDEEEEEEESVEGGENVRTRRISGWNLNEDGFELDPVFPIESPRDDLLARQVRFGGETIIPDAKTDQPAVEPGGPGESGRSGGSSPSSIAMVEETGQVVGSSLGQLDPVEELGAVTNQAGGSDGGNGISTMTDNQNILSTVEGIDRDEMLGGLMVLKRSLDDQREKVVHLIGQLGGEVTTEDQLMQIMESLKKELETEKHKNNELEMELRFLKLLISGAYSGGSVN